MGRSGTQTNKQKKNPPAKQEHTDTSGSSHTDCKFKCLLLKTCYLPVKGETHFTDVCEYKNWLVYHIHWHHGCKTKLTPNINKDIQHFFLDKKKI